MARFIKAHDYFTEKWVLLCDEDISRVEEQDDCTVVYYKQMGTDIDGTTKQLHNCFSEDIDYFMWALGVSDMQYIDRRKKNEQP